jgi:hypothetical protein
MRNKIISCSLALTFLMSSCATIVSGSKQNVKFEIKLARKSEHSVMLKLEGYQTYQTKLTKKFNAWFLGNILIGGLIGIIIDPITGAIYNLSPEEINAQMNKGIAFKSNGKDVYIAVALNIDSSWKKVGQLEKVNN